MAASQVDVPLPATEGHRVHIGNLAFSTTEDQVRQHIATAGGKISSVVLPLRFGKKPSGFGFVEYENEADAKNAVEKLNGSELDGRKIRLDPARSKEESDKARAANQERRDAARAKRAAERAEKAAAAGDTTAVTDGEAVDGLKKKRPAKKRTPRRRQPGEEGEEGTTAAEATDASPAAKQAGDGPARRKRGPRKAKEARIDGAEGAAGEATDAAAEKPKRDRKPRQKRETTGELSKTMIFVANLPFEVDDTALAAIFTNLSINVKSAKVATSLRRPRGDREQKPVRTSRGYGFVEVTDPAQQKEAVDKVEGTLVGDRQISAKVANELKPIEKAEGEGLVKEGKAEPAAATA